MGLAMALGCGATLFHLGVSPFWTLLPPSILLLPIKTFRRPGRPVVPVLLALAAVYRRRSLPAAQAAIPMLALAASGPFLIHVVSGMETALFTLLLVGTLLLADRFVAGPNGRLAVLLAVCGWLAALTR